MKDADRRDDITIRLEHGEPVVFGKDREKGPRRTADGSFEVAAVAEVGTADLVVHDAANPDPAQAFALSRLDSPAFEHTPIGIFRNVERPSYDQLMREQVDRAIEEQGAGDLAALLASG